MTLGQFIFMLSSPGNFLQIRVCVDSSTVESVVLRMADPYMGNAKGLEGGKESV